MVGSSELLAKGIIMEHIIIETIESLIKKRSDALKNHNRSLSSQIRNDLEKINIKLTDLSEGTMWNFIENQSQQSHHL
jgi:cysteinyl-tRNA synthetase